MYPDFCFIFMEDNLCTPDEVPAESTHLAISSGFSDSELVGIEVKKRQSVHLATCKNMAGIQLKY